MADEIKAVLSYAGDERFVGVSDSGHAHVIDFGAEKAAASPMEYLLFAIAGCTGADVVSILKKKRQVLTGYRIDISGERREEHPRSYRRIQVKHTLRGDRLDPASVARAIELSDQKYCSVAATVRPTAEIVTTFAIEQDPAFSATESVPV
ncbi:MAG: OsmC family protein [Bryobacteraceae bacterium]|nr:OsmC family protein [Bryobacteraceae bacterium]